jgi:hypothetical protein
MGRVLSPNDVYYNYDPWRSVRSVETQNPIINDPPASYLTLVSLLRNDPDSFHWNRYVGSGIPGFGSVGAAVLSPFIALPALLLPLTLFYSGVVSLKICAAFIGVYLWLREERLGRTPAAVGAMVFAGAGPYAVWWLWQVTNNVPLYGFALWMISRVARGKRVSVSFAALVALSFLLSGFPATVVYFAWIALPFALVKFFQGRRRFSIAALSRLVIAGLIAAALAAPMLAAFVQFLGRTGYLEGRSDAARRVGPYGIAHLAAFIDPYRLGDPNERQWLGQQQFSSSDNFVETTVYAGLLAIPLVLIGFAVQLRQLRPFWPVVLLLLLALLFLSTPLSHLVGSLPGMRYSPLARLRAVLPLATAFLAAAGFRQLMHWRAARFFRLPLVIACLIAVDLALFAARFYPYQLPEVARVPETPMISRLHALPQPFRIAPMFDAFWPNSAELFRIEDVRSHFGSEERYRRIFQRIDPNSWGKSGTVLMLNSLQSNLEDPFLSFLNAKYVYEQPSIDILRWKIYERTTTSEAVDGEVLLGSASTLRRAVSIPEGTFAIDLSLTGRSADASVQARIVDGEGRVLSSASRKMSDLSGIGKLYLPLRERSRAREATLELETDGLISIPAAAGSHGGSPVYGLVRFPLIHIAEQKDGRLFENVAALPRHYAVWDVRKKTFESLLEERDIDFATTAYVEQTTGLDLGSIASVPPNLRTANVSLRHYSGSEQLLRVSAPAPFFLVASEKVSPELEVRIDGARVAPTVTNGLFIGLAIPAGEHSVTISRRIGRGWWPFFFAGLIAFSLALWWDLRRRAPRRG